MRRQVVAICMVIVPALSSNINGGKQRLFHLRQNIRGKCANFISQFGAVKGSDLVAYSAAFAWQSGCTGA